MRVPIELVVPANIYIESTFRINVMQSLSQIYKNGGGGGYLNVFCLLVNRTTITGPIDLRFGK